ncbi:hypothetical protein EC991_005916 [Linnemannia zychae]|nr:hypothetical protein EC991_005916 [Linnemannia zychae]
MREPSVKEEKAPVQSAMKPRKLSCGRRLKRAIARLFWKPDRFKDGGVFNTLEVFTLCVSIPLIPAGIVFPYDPDQNYAPTATDFYKHTLMLFTENFAKPEFMISLPALGGRFESTAQLALCSNLLRRHLATVSSITSAIATPLLTALIKPLDPVELELIVPYFEDKDEQDYIFAMTKGVVKLFMTEPLWRSRTLAEVLMLVPSLDRVTYRQWLGFLLAKCANAPLVEFELLQALVQTVECAAPGCLDADDLGKITAIIRISLENTHNDTTDKMYGATLALSRLLDVMVEGKVEKLSRETHHDPLGVLLRELADSSDMYLKNQATYALQALANIFNDETRREFVLRQAGNIAIGLLGAASVLNLDVNGDLDGAREVYKFAVTVQETTAKLAEGARALQGTGQDILTSIRDSILSGARQIWYPALREAEQAIRNGRLEEFNRIVIQAPCRHKMEFQWGICHLLGEIAMDEFWDLTTRKLAIDFLVRRYRDDYNRASEIDRCILGTLRRIADLPESHVSDYAKSEYQRLKDTCGLEKQNIYRTYATDPLPPYMPRAHLSALPTSELLDRVQAKPNVTRRLRWLRASRQNESKLLVYIQPQAKPTTQSHDDSLFSLMDKTEAFLKGPRKVLLLLGDSGAGKSTFVLQLERTLWETYKIGDPIPLHINLSTINDPYDSMIHKRLNQLGFDNTQIMELKESNQPFIVICDGYDECQLTKNLYTTNLFNQKGQWNVKLVITCRMQYLGQDYRYQFQPNPFQQQQFQEEEVDLFQEAFIAPFSQDLIKEFVEQYVKQDLHDIISPGEPKWSTEKYLDKFNEVNGLMKLVSNPLLLTFAVRALPKVVSQGDVANSQLTRARLYNAFIEQWLENSMKKLQGTLAPEADKALRDLRDAGFVSEGFKYQKNLAAAIFDNQPGSSVVKYVHKNDKNTWKAEFFSDTLPNSLLRDSSPLTRSGSQYSLIHRSLLEYLYSRFISDPIVIKSNNPDDYVTVLFNHPLNKRSIVGEPVVLNFLVECMESDPKFKKLLYIALEVSKLNGGVSQAAANAISILVKAKVPFHGEDLSGVKIPGALLRGGLFDSTNFAGADLSGVNMSKAWLRNANINGANMAGVEFEELPHIELDSGIRNCAFSSDGRYLAVSTYHCSIEVFNTTTWEKINGEGLLGRAALAISPCGNFLANASVDYAADVSNIITAKVRFDLIGHTDDIDCITYSPNGNYIATGSKDTTVRIWSSKSGKNLRIFKGHTLPVTGVTFSPDGLIVASCSEDKSIRGVQIKTQQTVFILRTAAPVHSLAYSPDGRQLASCGDRAELKLWNVTTSAENNFLTSQVTSSADYLLEGHNGPVFSVTYSPDGGRVASCGDDGTIRFWNPRNGAPCESMLADRGGTIAIAFSKADKEGLFVSGGKDARLRLWKTGGESSNKQHDNDNEPAFSVMSTDISMDGEWVATGSKDGMVRLWETLTGKPGAELKGHSSDVIGVAFSPIGNRIASSSKDSTVLLWCLKELKILHRFSSETNIGPSLAFSPTAKHLAISLADHTILVCDTKNFTDRCLPTDHKDVINGFVYSPSGDQVASWSNDKNVQLWTRSFKPLNILKHEGEVTHVAYNHTGDYLIAAVAGHSVIWDLKTYESITLPSGSPGQLLDGSISWCAFTPDGNYLATVKAEDNRFRLWDVTNFKVDVGSELYQSAFGSAFGHVWRKSETGSMIVASIDMSCSLRVEELRYGVSGSRGGEGSSSNGGLRLLWSVGTNTLNLENAITDNVHNLSKMNKQLIEQKATAKHLLVWSEGSTEKYFEEGGYYDNNSDESEEEVDSVDEDEDVDIPGLEEDDDKKKKKSLDRALSKRGEKRLGIKRTKSLEAPLIVDEDLIDEEKRRLVFQKKADLVYKKRTRSYEAPLIVDEDLVNEEQKRVPLFQKKEDLVYKKRARSFEAPLIVDEDLVDEEQKRIPLFQKKEDLDHKKSTRSFEAPLVVDEDLVDEKLKRIPLFQKKEDLDHKKSTRSFEAPLVVDEDLVDEKLKRIPLFQKKADLDYKKRTRSFEAPLIVDEDLDDEEQKRLLLFQKKADLVDEESKRAPSLRKQGMTTKKKRPQV